jgi:hypothetical protein
MLAAFLDAVEQHSTAQYSSNPNEYFSFDFEALIIHELKSF